MSRVVTSGSKFGNDALGQVILVNCDKGNRRHEIGQPPPFALFSPVLDLCPYNIPRAIEGGVGSRDIGWIIQ